MDSGKKQIFLSFLLLAFSIIWTSVYFLNKSKLQIIHLDSPVPAEIYPTLQAKPEIDTSLRSHYRENLQRTGFTSEKLKTPVRLYKKLPDLNQGPHTASKSSPLADQDGIVVASDLGKLYSYSWAGEKVWQLNTAASYKGFHGTAVMNQTDIWIGSYNGNLYRIDRKTGMIRWVLPIGDTIGSSPLLNQNWLYVTVETNANPNGFIAKIDAQTGQIHWTSKFLGDQIHSSPTFSVEGDALFFGANNGVFFSVNEETGQINWTFQAGDSIKSTPTVTKDSVFFTSWDQFLYCLDAQSGKLKWKTPLKWTSQSSPSLLLEKNIVFVGDDAGYISAIDLANGEIKWQLQDFSSVKSSALIFQGSKSFELAIGCGFHHLCILEAETGKEIQRLNTISKVTGQARITKGKLMVASDRDGLWIWDRE